MKRLVVPLTAFGACLSLIAAGALSTLHACVPADTRPTPGSLTVTVSPSPAILQGFLTADGWQVTYERVLVGIGDPSISDDCAQYSQANYDRILDVTSKENQKLGILYGLGQCDVRFRVSPPSSDTVLGAGVTEDDKTRMRTGGSDAYVPLGGIAVDVMGSAVLGATTKHFHFVFRPRIRYRECALDPDAGTPAEQGAGVKLESNAALVYDLRIEAEALFRDARDATGASLRFGPFASADVDGDGNVTLEELSQIPITTLREAGAFEAGTYDFDDDAGVVRDGQPVLIQTLADYVYIVLLPTLPRFRDTGACTGNISLRNGRRD